MRASIGILGSIAIFFVGLVAVGLEADSVQSSALNASNTSSNAYNATRGVFEGIGAVGGQAIAIVGVIVFLLLCAGIWVTVYGGR